MPLWKKKKKKKRFTNPSFDVQATHSCSNVIRLNWKRKKDLLKCLFFFFLKVHFNERRKSIRVRVRVGLNNYLTLPRQADKYDDMWWRKAHSIRDNGKNDFLKSFSCRHSLWKAATNVFATVDHVFLGCLLNLRLTLTGQPSQGVQALL